jgi:histidinol phosphatase-like enzyme
MRRCVFLDRDGVINLKPAPGEYIRAWAEIRLTPPSSIGYGCSMLCTC